MSIVSQGCGVESVDSERCERSDRGGLGTKTAAGRRPITRPIERKG